MNSSSHWKKNIYSVGQLFNDYSWTMFLAPHILIRSWMIHFFLFMNGSSTQCRKQSIMWENILMIVHEWCFYLRSWTSTFNPFMNGSFLPVHEWFIIVFDKILMIIHKLPWIRHSWTGIGTCSLAWLLPYLIIPACSWARDLLSGSWGLRLLWSRWHQKPQFLFGPAMFTGSFPTENCLFFCIIYVKKS